MNRSHWIGASQRRSPRRVRTEEDRPKEGLREEEKATDVDSPTENLIRREGAEKSLTDRNADLMMTDLTGQSAGSMMTDPIGQSALMTDQEETTDRTGLTGPKEVKGTKEASETDRLTASREETTIDPDPMTGRSDQKDPKGQRDLRDQIDSKGLKDSDASTLIGVSAVTSAPESEALTETEAEPRVRTLTSQRNLSAMIRSSRQGPERTARTSSGMKRILILEKKTEKKPSCEPTPIDWSKSTMGVSFCLKLQKNRKRSFMNSTRKATGLWSFRERQESIAVM